MSSIKSTVETMKMNSIQNEKLESIRQRFANIPGRAGRLFIVGGAVRDSFMGIQPKDVDFVCVGDVDDIVSMFGNCEPVHPHAPVFAVRFGGDIFEVALARSESGTGNSSEDFVFKLVDDITVDLFRRDVTINAIAVDVHTGSIVDPCGGIADIDARVLRRASGWFADSPERVGRVAMMVARFGFTPDTDLVLTCRSMVRAFSAIPAEQKWNQFFGKMLSHGRFFVAAFEFLESCGAIAAFPELVAMRNCPQDARHHPEGDVLSHTLLTMEFAARHMPGRGFVAAVMLMHDMGKPAVTVVESSTGNVTAHGHEHEHEAILSFMDRIHFPHALRERALMLIECHMRKNNIPHNRSRARLLRKLASAGVTAGEFADVIFADINGRGGDVIKMLPHDVIEFVKFANEFTPEQASKQARPLIDGNDLRNAGFKPGRIFTEILDAVAVAFLAGECTTREQALALAESMRNE